MSRDLRTTRHAVLPLIVIVSLGLVPLLLMATRGGPCAVVLIFIVLVGWIVVRLASTSESLPSTVTAELLPDQRPESVVIDYAAPRPAALSNPLRTPLLFCTGLILGPILAVGTIVIIGGSTPAKLAIAPIVVIALLLFRNLRPLGAGMLVGLVIGVMIVASACGAMFRGI